MPRCASNNHFSAKPGDKNCVACAKNIARSRNSLRSAKPNIRGFAQFGKNPSSPAGTVQNNQMNDIYNSLPQKTNFSPTGGKAGEIPDVFKIPNGVITENAYENWKTEISKAQFKNEANATPKGWVKVKTQRYIDGVELKDSHGAPLAQVAHRTELENGDIQFVYINSVGDPEVLTWEKNGDVVREIVYPPKKIGEKFFLPKISFTKTKNEEAT